MVILMRDEMGSKCDLMCTYIVYGCVLVWMYACMDVISVTTTGITRKIALTNTDKN